MLGSLAGYGSDSDDERMGTSTPAGSMAAGSSKNAAPGPSKTVKAAALGIKRPAPSPKPMSPAPEVSTSRQPSAELVPQRPPSAQTQESQGPVYESSPADGPDEWPLARYGLAPPDPSLQPDAALQAKLTNFHALSAQGHNFNSTLERNKSFRNPHILDTLVRFVSVNERGSILPSDVWDADEMLRQGSAKRLGEIQKQREKDREERQTKGPRRDRIGFESGSSSKRERSRSPPPRHGYQRDRDRHRR